jgi:hypothetical protein
MANAALGVRVKSGWGSAIVLTTEHSQPRFLHRARLLLSNPKAPRSSQPYHRGFGSLQKDPAVLKRLTRVVRAATARSLRALVLDCSKAGHPPVVAVALVVGSTIEPERITNEHIRAHAFEARLFRTALEQAAGRLGLRCSVTRERDLERATSAALGSGAPATAAALGKAAGRPWRADEKLATLAAWAALAQPEPRRRRRGS